MTRLEQLTADLMSADAETRIEALESVAWGVNKGLISFHEAEEIMDRGENERENA